MSLPTKALPPVKMRVVFGGDPACVHRWRIEEANGFALVGGACCKCPATIRLRSSWPEELDVISRGLGQWE